ncbi:MAG: FprA family A-type flavoprotein [Deltaproteobacteria bacterium]|nr:FprA family A-type flavoprotein [Deltaproteobacteria bacterium]MBW2176551.1 FprA family A-type flavoprotein [Deltaproteobacteria bacterium]MBW2297241.1 FprA family A-type flavoprotein [Deltaproteobacteria bacterium]
MGKVLVVFATRAGETEKIANLIAEGVRFTGNEARVKNAKDIKNETDLQGFDAYAFGSATYHGDMMAGMKTLLFLAEKAGLENKVGSGFGAFGWSGEAPDRIFETMANIFQMNMVTGPLRLKSSTLGGGIQMAQDYGKQIAEKLQV